VAASPPLPALASPGLLSSRRQPASGWSGWSTGTTMPRRRSASC